MMTTKSKKIERILMVLLAVVAVLCITCSAAAAVTVSANTSGLTGKTGDTVRVPVMITDMPEVGAYQLIVGIKDDDTAKIEVDTTTLRGASSDKNGVIMYSESADLDGTEPLFELLVTPKTADDVTIELSNVRVYNPSLTNAGAVAVSSVLTVDGEGSGKTIDDANGGSTSSSGSTDSSGNYKTGNSVGVSVVTTPGHENEPVMVYTSTVDLPDGVKSFFSNKVYTSTAGGEAYQVSMLLPTDKLIATGKSTGDLFILHQVDGTWYTVPITSVVTEGDSVTIKFTAWSSGDYVLAYDAGGQTFPTETESTTSEPTIVPEDSTSTEAQTSTAGTSSSGTQSQSSSSFNITEPPLLYILIGGGVVVVAVIVIIVIRSRRKRNF